MVDWWRSWHGAPTDPKWIAVGRRAKVPPGVVASIAWALMDCASQAEERGSVSAFDPESVAYFFGWKITQVVAVVAAMREKGLIAGDRLAAWTRRQPERERDDDSRDRMRKLRGRRKAIEPGQEASDGEPDGAAHDGEDAAAAVTHVTHVTPCDAMLRPESESESESESEKIPDRDDSASTRADERSGEEERRLEADCRRKVEGLPVSISLNFSPMFRLIGQGMTRDDLLTGIDQALDRGVVPRTWSVFENFVREVAKDRLERALPGAGTRAFGAGNQRAGPNVVAIKTNRYLQTILEAEHDARNGINVIHPGA